MTTQDLNSLTISGRVHSQPQLHEYDHGDGDGDGDGDYTFTLTHTTDHHHSGHWELQLYQVSIWQPASHTFIEHFALGQRIAITGRLDCVCHETLTGYQPVVSIIAVLKVAITMATQPLRVNHHQARQHTLLIATTDHDQRTFLAVQLDADGHTVYEADSAQAAIARLSAHAIDLMVLGRLHRPADAPALLRAVRAGEHPRIHPSQPVITLGADNELTTLRAYENGSDHHLPDDTGYLLLRAVLASVLRRTVDTLTSRHLHVAGMHIDLASRTVEIDGSVVCLSPIEFELLVAFAADPVRVFNRDELSRCIWDRVQISGRTVDSHVCRLRTRLVDAGARGVLVNRWGHGWSLTTTAH